MTSTSADGDWETWVGRTSEATAHLDPEHANRMAATLDRAPTFRSGDELPPAWHWLYFHDIVPASALGNDGHPALGVVMPPVPLERRMWAGGKLSFDRPLRLGSTATRTSRIASIESKTGRTGDLYFVAVEHELAADDSPAIREAQTIVYRELDPAESGTAPEAPSGAEVRRTWEMDSTTLFRYSALTFNGHRIHYDADYAREVEGYPGLVVHGPLLATLLADLATEQRGSLSTFRYRARSPLFAPSSFTVNGASSDDGLALWAASTDGRLAMDAAATFERNHPS